MPPRCAAERRDIYYTRGRFACSLFLCCRVHVCTRVRVCICAIRVRVRTPRNRNLWRRAPAALPGCRCRFSCVHSLSEDKHRSCKLLPMQCVCRCSSCFFSFSFFSVGGHLYMRFRRFTKGSDEGIQTATLAYSQLLCAYHTQASTPRAYIHIRTAERERERKREREREREVMPEEHGLGAWNSLRFQKQPRCPIRPNVESGGAADGRKMGELACVVRGSGSLHICVYLSPISRHSRMWLHAYTHTLPGRACRGPSIFLGASVFPPHKRPSPSSLSLSSPLSTHTFPPFIFPHTHIHVHSHTHTYIHTLLTFSLFFLSLFFFFFFFFFLLHHAGSSPPLASDVPLARRPSPRQLSSERPN